MMIVMLNKGIMVHGAFVVCDFMKVFMMRSILEVLLAQFSLYICSQKYLAVTFIDLIFLLVDIADRCNRPDYPPPPTELYPGIFCTIPGYIEGAPRVYPISPDYTPSDAGWV